MSIALTQKAISTRSTGTTVSATFASTPVQNHLLVACLGTDQFTFNTPSGWTAAVTQTVTKVAGGIFYKVAGASESKTVTFDGLTAGIAILSILEYEGIASASPLDKTASFDETTNQSAITSGTTAVTTQAAELAVALVGFEKNADTSTSWTNSFLEQNTSMDPAGVPADISIGVSHKILSATAAQETTWTVANASKGSGYIATFKAGHVFTVPVVDLAYTTTAATVVATTNHLRNVPVVDLTFSTTAPIRAIDRSLVVPVVDLTYTPTAPAISVGKGFTVPAADLSLTPTPPLQLEIYRDIPTVDLVFTPTAPSIDLGPRISVPRVDLAFSTVVPTPVIFKWTEISEPAAPTWAPINTA